MGPRTRPPALIARPWRPIVLVLGILVVGGCSLLPSPVVPVPPPVGADRIVALTGTSWRIVSINETDLGIDPLPTLDFTADAVLVEGPCNGLGANYRFEPATGTLALDHQFTTVVGCRGREALAEEAILRALRGLSLAGMDAKGHLVLTGSSGKLVLLPGLP